MRYILSIILCLWASYAWAFPPGFIGAITQCATQSGEPACSGDWSSGDNEAFESTGDNTCTTDWAAEGDVSGILSASSTNAYHTGSQSLEVAMSATSQRAYKTADLGATDGTFSVRFYLRTPSNMATFTTGHPEPFEGAVSGPNSSDRLWVRINSVGVYATSNTLSSTITLSASTWYRLEVDYIASSSSCTLAVYDGASETSVGSATFQCRSDALRYFSFGQNASSTTEYATYYIDDIKFSASGGVIGAQ